MKQISFCFFIHQPFRLKRYRFFDMGYDHYYYDDYANEYNMRRLVEESILPANSLIYELIGRTDIEMKVNYLISGVALDQFELYAPETIDSFKRLADTGKVEFVCSTDCESLSSIMNRELFVEQVKSQRTRLKTLFGTESQVFCNTQMIYSNAIGDVLTDLGFKAVLTEGANHLLGWKSPDYVYCSATNPRLKILLRNWRLSDGIGMQFSNRDWSEFPLTADKYAGWLSSGESAADSTVIAVDYSYIGERNRRESGIFDFLNYLPSSIQKNGIELVTLGELADNQPVGILSVNEPISWVDEERDITAWIGNELQQEALNKLYALADDVRNIKDEDILMDWRYLQAVNHFRFMSTKYFSTKRVFSVSSPYSSPYDAFINYMNVLSDFALRVKKSVENN